MTSKENPIVLDDDDDIPIAKKVHPKPFLGPQKESKYINIDDSDDDDDIVPRSKKHSPKPHNVDPVPPIKPSVFKVDMSEACVKPPVVAPLRPPAEGISITLANACNLYRTHPYTEVQRAFLWTMLCDRVRIRIGDDLCRKDTGNPIDSKDLAFIFEAFDTVYFKGSMWKIVCENHGVLKFAISNLKSTKAGQCSKKACEYEIKLYLPIFRQLFTAPEHKHFISNGLKCHSRLECFLNVFSHELCHLIIQRFCYDQVRKLNKEKSHGKTFRAIVRHLFGHTEFLHNLAASHSNITSFSDTKKVIQDAYYKNSSHIFTFDYPPTYVGIKCQIKRLNPKRPTISYIKDGKRFTIKVSYRSLTP